MSNFTDRDFNETFSLMFEDTSFVGIFQNVYETMTSAERRKREEIVLSMKDSEEALKAKYGSRWKEVMYATATKIAMRESVELIGEDHFSEKQLSAMKSKFKGNAKVLDLINDYEYEDTRNPEKAGKIAAQLRKIMKDET